MPPARKDIFLTEKARGIRTGKSIRLPKMTSKKGRQQDPARNKDIFLTEKARGIRTGKSFCMPKVTSKKGRQQDPLALKSIKIEYACAMRWTVNVGLVFARLVVFSVRSRMLQ